MYSGAPSSKAVWFRSIVVGLSFLGLVNSFAVVLTGRPLSSPIRRRPHSDVWSLHCICINCKWVTSCSAYHFVETKHEQPHMTENPTFEPRNGSPTIHVNIRTQETPESQKESQRLWEEHEAETKWAEEQAAATATMDQQPKLYGQQKYNLQPKVTMEYDVVKCEDYVQDMGCWVRNMPEEIRKANPDFVPT